MNDLIRPLWPLILLERDPHTDPHQRPKEQGQGLVAQVKIHLINDLESTSFSIQFSCNHLTVRTA
jgi:hypothetical protein